MVFFVQPVDHILDILFGGPLIVETAFTYSEEITPVPV
jgi:hypothetical protein